MQNLFICSTSVCTPRGLLPDQLETSGKEGETVGTEMYTLIFTLVQTVSTLLDTLQCTLYIVHFNVHSSQK